MTTICGPMLSLSLIPFRSGAARLCLIPLAVGVLLLALEPREGRPTEGFEAPGVTEVRLAQGVLVVTKWTGSGGDSRRRTMHLTLIDADGRTIGTARTTTGRTDWMGFTRQWSSKVATWDVPAEGTYTLKAEYPPGMDGPTLQIGWSEQGSAARVAMGVALFLGSLVAAFWIDARWFFREWQASTTWPPARS